MRNERAHTSIFGQGGGIAVLGGVLPANELLLGLLLI